MFLLNKNNKGYNSPMEFDSYCYLAQMDLFENLFYRYNKWINNKDSGFSNSEFADIPKNIQEQIDVFSTYSTNLNFTYSVSDDLWSFIGNDLYRTVNLSLKNLQGKSIDLEEVLKGAELNKLINSKINPPTLTFPIYVKVGKSYRTFPKVPTGFKLDLLYIRTPKAPKWTFINVNGNPVYDAGASDRQDFELDEVLFSLLVTKILSYSGISIREADVVEVAEGEINQTEQKQS